MSDFRRFCIAFVVIYNLLWIAGLIFNIPLPLEKGVLLSLHLGVLLIAVWGRSQS